jgi:hypothetical protein
VIHTVLTPGVSVADNHQTGPLQLAVDFPIRVHVNVPVSFDVQAKQGQGFLREHGAPPHRHHTEEPPDGKAILTGAASDGAIM